MKNYFTKYLPVEGEIKAGDKHICLDNGLVCDTRADMVYFVNNENHKKVKLFLCSRDIQVGDIVKTRYYEGLKDFHCGNEGARQAAINNGSFKIIGEISPDALRYVKEGDEFDEGEWKDEEDKFDRKNYNDLYKLIKGPCGHFH